MTAAEFTGANTSGNDEIIRNTSAIARGRVLHTATRLLSRVVPNKTTAKLEFEYRYQRYVAEFGEEAGPFEETNLFNDEAQADHVRDLTARIRLWQHRTADRAPLPAV